MISFLNNLEKKICEPDTNFFPDLDERKDLYIKNKGQYWCSICFLVIYWIISFFYKFPIQSHIFWVAFAGIQLVSLVCFCRTRIWICHWIYTVTLTLSPFIFVKLFQDSFIYALISSISSPFFIMQITRNVKHVIGNFVGQLFMLHMPYKHILKQCLSQMSPERFSESYVNAATFILITCTMSYIFMSKTLQDAHIQLKMSKCESEEAYSQLRLFLQTFSHELRNPLNSLLGNLQLVLQESLPSKTCEMITSAKICGELLLQLINNILDTGKAQIGKLDVSKNPTKVGDLIEGVWRISRELIRRKKLNGYLKVDGCLPSVLYLDFYRVNQVLLNLISNSIKFTNKGQISLNFIWIQNSELSEKCFTPCPYDDDGLVEKNENISITLDRRTDYLLYLESNLRILKNCFKKPISYGDHGILKIVVKDSGSGIQAENIQKLFSKFSQVSDDPTQRKIGTGLGLYITKEICNQMGGEVRAYSKVDIGTTIIVCIPTHCPIHSVNLPESIEITSPLMKKKVHVLVVDDNVFNIDLLSNYLCKINGEIVETAKNGLEGYSKFKDIKRMKKELDVIFLDIDMPVMDGKAMCFKIREFEKTNNLEPVKIVFVSGNYDESQINELIDKTGKYRGDAFLKKPIPFEKFSSIVRRLEA